MSVPVVLLRLAVPLVSTDVLEAGAAGAGAESICDGLGAKIYFSCLSGKIGYAEVELFGEVELSDAAWVPASRHRAAASSGSRSMAPMPSLVGWQNGLQSIGIGE